MIKASEANKLSAQNNKELNKKVIDELIKVTEEMINKAVGEGKFDTNVAFGMLCRNYCDDDAGIKSIYKIVSNALNEYGYRTTLHYTDGFVKSSIMTISWVNV